MKQISTLLFVLLAFCAKAQLPANSIAPDFTATDINGNTVHLYEILEQGKTVVMDISATWCGPCWSYHNSGALESLYETLGDGGAGNTVVLFIEGDASTTLADLQGTGGNTQGNWTAGTHYPIIDDASIGDLYAITYFPTIYKICPSTKQVTEINQLSSSALLTNVLNTTCMPAAAGKDVAFGGFVGNTEVCGGSTPLKVKLFNNGADAITNATIDVKVGNSVVASEAWSGTMNTYQFKEVDFGSVTLGAGDVTFDVTTTGDANVNNNNGEATYTVVPTTSQKTYTVEILTDNYGGETYWELRGADGTVYGTGGNSVVGPDGGGAQSGNTTGAGAYGNNATSATEVTVPSDGCYDFYIVDDYGDGMCCAYGNGYYKVTAENGDIIAQGGQYGSTESKGYEVAGSVSANEAKGLNAMNVFPNPASDVVNITFDLEKTSKLQINVTNALGQIMYSYGNTQYNAGSHALMMNTNSFANGMYVITIADENGVSTRKFSVSK